MCCALAHAYESTRAVIKKMAKRVRFSDSAVEAAREGSEHEEDDHSSAEDSFCEITTSEGESSSNDEDAKQMAGAFGTGVHEQSRSIFEFSC